MGSTKKSKDRDRKKRKRERSRSKERHHRHHHKHKKHKRSREERSPSINLSDLSVSDLEAGFHNEDVQKDSVQNKPDLLHQEPMQENVKPSSSSKEISMSVADTNKLRAKLGLKPLVEKAHVKSMSEMNTEGDYKAGEEVHNPPQNISEKLQINKLREKFAANKEKRKYESKLRKLKGLGESDEEDSSALAWIAKSRKMENERKLAEKTNKMLSELEDQFGIGDLVEKEIVSKKKSKYSSNHLSGLKIDHEASRFDGGHSTILTLKDSNILDEDEDTLINVNIIDAERVERNLRNKRKKTDAVDYHTPELDKYGNVVENTVLGKYDEEIAGEAKSDGFRIGDHGESMKLKEEAGKMAKINKLRHLASLEGPSQQLATEYMTPGEMVNFKRVRKRVKKKRFTADDLEPIEDDGTNYGSRNAVPGRQQEPLPKEETSQDDESTLRHLTEEEDAPATAKMEVDDDAEATEKIDIELQEALARSRRVKLKAVRDWSCESAAQQLGAIKVENGEAVIKQEPELNVTMNITDEFCRTLGDIPTYGLSGNRIEEEGATLQITSPTKDDEEKQGAWEEVGIDSTKVEITNDMVVPILEEEPSAGSGIAMALELAKKKGYLEKDDSKKITNAALQHLRAVNYSIEDKAIEDDRRGGGRDRYMGPITDFREKDGYRPDVKLQYVDDEGRKLCSKEAFRYLSHKFHGKGSGKNKLEKRMKKWKEEQNLKYMHSCDTPLQTLERQREKQKQMGTAYIVLSSTKAQESLNIKK